MHDFYLIGYTYTRFFILGDHGYARVWANVTFEDLEQMDEDIQNSEIWAGSSVDVSNVEINRAGYSGKWISFVLIVSCMLRSIA